jgi:hypothetical protein
MHRTSRGTKVPWLAATLPFASCAIVVACGDYPLAAESDDSPSDPLRDDASVAVADGPAAAPVPAYEPSPTPSAKPDPQGEHPLSLVITSPENGAVIELPPDGRLPVRFASALDFRDARTCPDAGATAPCGHGHLTIDGVACNANRALPDGGTRKETFNVNVGGGSPTYADFSLCPQPVDGTHVIEIELRQDNHAPMNPVIKDSVTVTVTGPEGGFVRDAATE